MVLAMMIFEWFMKTSVQWAQSQESLKKCVFLVLEKLQQNKIARLARVTFTKSMFVERWCLAQIHVASLSCEKRAMRPANVGSPTQHLTFNLAKIF